MNTHKLFFKKGHKILRIILFFGFGLFVTANKTDAQTFDATGPDSLYTGTFQSPVHGAVMVTFDTNLTKQKLSFDLPWDFCSIAEDGLKFGDFAVETYDNRINKIQGAGQSFEPGMDVKARYARVWIKSKNQARIVVAVRYAPVAAPDGKKLLFAHADFPNNSPFSDSGDFVEEFWYIYPDGTHTRDIRTHTGLASESLPFSFNREPPIVVHEFMEMVVIGEQPNSGFSTNHNNPLDDLDSLNTVTLYKMFSDTIGKIYPDGLSKSFDFKHTLRDFGEFHDANMIMINSNTIWKPYTIALPYGLKVDNYAYNPDDGDPNYPYTTWIYGHRSDEKPYVNYITAIGHFLNYWHYRRTDKLIEQIYLRGMTDRTGNSAKKDITHLAWSWINAPVLTMPGYTPDYNKVTYDQAQKAYIVPRTSAGVSTLSFNLNSRDTASAYNGTNWVINPAFVIQNWNSTKNVTVDVIAAGITQNITYKVGHEGDANDDLIIWVKGTFDLTAISEHRITVQITPK